MGRWGDAWNAVTEPFEEIVDVVVDSAEDIGGAVVEAAGGLADATFDVGKGVYNLDAVAVGTAIWDSHEVVIDAAADIAETVAPVLDVAGPAVGMPWISGIDEALGAVSDIMDGEMPDLGEVFGAATSIYGGLDASSLLGIDLGELDLDDLGGLGVEALGDALGVDLGSATSFLPIDDLVEALGGEELGSIWDAVEEYSDLDLGDLAKGLDDVLGDNIPDSITDLVDQIDDGDFGQLLDALGDEGGVGDFLKALDADTVAEVLDMAVTDGKAGELLDKLDEADLSSLLQGVGGDRLGQVVDALDSDELSGIMGKLDGDAVANVIGQATSSGILEDVFEKLDPTTLADTVTTMMTGPTGDGTSAGIGGPLGSLIDRGTIMNLTAQDSMTEISSPWGGFGGSSGGSSGGSTLWDTLGTTLETVVVPVVDSDVLGNSELDQMKEFVDGLDLTDEQREAYEEMFPEEAPTDAERIEDLEDQLEDMQDQLDDILGEDAVDGEPDPGSDTDADTDVDDLGLDVDLEAEEVGGLDQVDEPDGADVSAGVDPVDDVGDSIGDVAEPEPDFEPVAEPEPVVEPEPEPVVDTFDQQMDAAESVETSVDDMFDGG